MNASKKLVMLSLLILAVFVLGTYFILEGRSEVVSREQPIPAVADDGRVAEMIEATPAPKTLRTFSPNGFKELFDSLALPNTAAIVSLPPITGDEVADARIRSIAEARGYKLRSVPSSLLNISDGYNVQERVIQDWEALKAEAAQNGVFLAIISGYRAPEVQQQIFMGQLNAIGYSLAQIANGQADAAINQILDFYSIPGYSKHHTGYAIDIEDSGSGLEGFAATKGFAWMSANNYENAKRFGFIPSYPEGATNQGPVPEPWEYVWVGRDNLLE